MSIDCKKIEIDKSKFALNFNLNEEPFNIRIGISSISNFGSHFQTQNGVISTTYSDLVASQAPVISQLNEFSSKKWYRRIAGSENMIEVFKYSEDHCRKNSCKNEKTSYFEKKDRSCIPTKFQRSI